MAQFVQSQQRPNQVLQGSLVQNPVLVQQPVVQQQPLYVSQARPVFVQGQVLVQPVQQPKESDNLLGRNSRLHHRLQQFLFFGPLVFFLVVLVFSASIYGLRFRNTDGTTPAAVDTLVNLGSSLDINPILRVELLEKKTNGKASKCKTDLPEDVKHRDQYEDVLFDQFGQIREGCVCETKRYNNLRLTYHDVEYCENDYSNCKVQRNRDLQSEDVYLETHFCVRRVRDFRWLKEGDTKTCKDYNDQVQNLPMRQCGPQFCVSQEFNDEDDYKKSYEATNLKVCPLSQLVVSKDAPTKPEDQWKAGASTSLKLKGENADGLSVHYLQESTNRPVVNVVTSVSNPRCLAEKLQKPLRLSHRYYRLQNLRETGCYPYGAHVRTATLPNDKATYLESYVEQVKLEDHYNAKNNDVKTADIAFYDQYVRSSEDRVNLYAELRPYISKASNCVDQDIANVSFRAKSLLLILNLVEIYSFWLVLFSSLGLFVSVLFLVLRNKNFVNSTTQLYLHLFTGAVALALFVYPIVFWVKYNRFDTVDIQNQFQKQLTYGCYMYNGQQDAASHLLALVKLTNNEVFGLTTFLFVFDVVFALLVAAAAFLRFRDRLVVCDPVKSSALYYE